MDHYNVGITGGRMANWTIDVEPRGETYEALIRFASSKRAVAGLVDQGFTGNDCFLNFMSEFAGHVISVEEHLNGLEPFKAMAISSCHANAQNSINFSWKRIQFASLPLIHLECTIGFRQICQRIFHFLTFKENLG